LPTYLDQRFLITRQDYYLAAGHDTLTTSGLALNRPIRARMAPKRSRGTATSAIWNTTYRECLITLAPILMSLSRSVVSDHFLTDLGNANRLKKLPRL
jgi:hypothetical protein